MLQQGCIAQGKEVVLQATNEFFVNEARKLRPYCG